MTDVKYPELPEGWTTVMTPHPDGPTATWFDEYQMRSYADATCALRGAQKESDAAPGAPQQEEVVMCNRCGGTGYVDDGYLTHSKGGIRYSEPIKCIKDCPACNGDGRVASRAAATAPAIQLGADGQKVFAETLLNPPPPTAAFLKAEERYSNLIRPEATAPAGGVTPTAAEVVDYCARHGVSPAKAKEALAGAARAAEPATTINGEAPNAHNLLAALVDIYDDGQNNPPEHRTYVDGAWGDALDAARKFLAARAAEPEGFYVASRASIPERPAMWQGLRLLGWPITSTWIDEAGEGETDDMGELWRRIHDEIQRSTGVLLYAEADDFPLKGALIECGIALGMGKPVAVVLPRVSLHPRSLKPLGSWAAHPLVTRYDNLEAARQALAASPTPPTGTSKEGGEKP